MHPPLTPIILTAYKSVPHTATNLSFLISKADYIISLQYLCNVKSKFLGMTCMVLHVLVSACQILNFAILCPLLSSSPGPQSSQMDVLPLYTFVYATHYYPTPLFNHWKWSSFKTQLEHPDLQSRWNVLYMCSCALGYHGAYLALF